MDIDGFLLAIDNLSKTTFKTHERNIRRLDDLLDIYDKPNINNPKNINTPILILHGDQDPYSNENDLKNLLDELREKNSKWFLHIFGGVAHAFTNPDADDELNGLKYNRDAMHMSWKIMKNYFNRFLDEKL